MNRSGLVLIIARSAPLRTSLGALIASSGQVKSVRLELDLGSLDPLPWLAAQPALVVLVNEPAEANLRQVLETINATWPDARTLVLVDSERDWAEIQSIGAAVLFKGVLAATLLNTIEGLMRD